MSEGSFPILKPGEQAQQRILGQIDQGRSGPTFLAQGGIHGNEPAGVLALRRVLAVLEDCDIPVYGRFMACVGNLRALKQESRFIDRDLNRQWLSDTVAKLRAQDPGEDEAEDHEQRDLLNLYQRCYDKRQNALVFVDLHSSSADGPPFTCMADTIPNRRIADAVPVPMILGLEECIDGAVMEWFNSRGQIGVAVEGGRHDDPSTVDNLESAVWLAMIQAGSIDAEHVDVEKHRQRLIKAARGVAHVVEIRARHAIEPADKFTMVPGYVSFQPITQDELLAHDREGPIRAPDDGMILLPLYQGLGEDGFFTCRAIKRFWYHLSFALRAARASHLLRFLPGVQRSIDDPNTLEVDPKVARWMVVEVFHLFGFRRERRHSSGRQAFSRRWASEECYQVRPRGR